MSWHAAHAPLLWALGLILGACASPVAHFHSLLPPPAEATPSAPAARARVEFAPIVLPPQVDRPQWVLRRDDGTLELLEYERWIAPLADELQAALATRLQRSTGMPQAAADGGPWRVGLEVLRWDARLGRYSRIEVRWQLGSRAEVLRNCSAVLEQAAPGGLETLALAHRELVGRLGDAIAQSHSGC